MKVAGLIIAIVLMVLSGLGFLICLILPGMNSHVSVQEAMVVAVPLALLCFVSFLAVIVSAILVIRSRTKAPSGNV
jgi:uncharacterized membrane protein